MLGNVAYHLVYEIVCSSCNYTLVLQVSKIQCQSSEESFISSPILPKYILKCMARMISLEKQKLIPQKLPSPQASACQSANAALMIESFHCWRLKDEYIYLRDPC